MSASQGIMDEERLPQLKELHDSVHQIRQDLLFEEELGKGKKAYPPEFYTFMNVAERIDTLALGETALQAKDIEKRVNNLRDKAKAALRKLAAKRAIGSFAENWLGSEENSK